MTYAEKLLDQRWLYKRASIIARDNHRCQLCGDIDSVLHVHHIRYIGEPWDAPNDALITYCEHCHYLVEHSEYPVLKVSKFPVFNKPRSYHILLLYRCGNGHFIGIAEYDGFSKLYKHIDVIPEAHFYSISEFIKKANGEKVH